MHAHVHLPAVADGHDGLEEILHVCAQLLFVDTVIECQERAEYLHRPLIMLCDVAVDEPLCLHDDVLHQPVFVFGGEVMAHALHFLQRLGCVVGLCTLALEYLAVEICKLCMAEIEA